MPKPFHGLPTELLLIIGEALEARGLYSLVRTSRQFSDLFLSRLRNLALEKRNTHAAIYWATATRNRAMLKHILEEGEKVVLVERGSSKGREVHCSGRVCSEWILACMLNWRSNIVLDGAEFGNRSRTPLSWALRMSHLGLLRLLFDMADVMSHQKNLALSEAASNGNVRAVKLLIEKGADPNCQRNGLTSLEIATSKNHIDVVKLLLEHGGDIAAGGRPLFLFAEEKCNRELAELLVETQVRANPDFIDPESNRSALYLAAQFSNESLVRYVLENGDQVTLRLENHLGLSPLDIAKQRGDVAITKLLMDYNKSNTCKISMYTLLTTVPYDLVK